MRGLEAQYKYNAKRLDDIQKLYASGSNTEFKEQDTQVQFETVGAQLNVAKATQQSAKLALDSEIGGVNTTVAQMQAQLENAVWELTQTTIRAPADGYATAVALTVGDRASQLRSVMSFIVENEITIVGMFSQNGFQTIKAGAPVNIVFDNVPGRVYHAKDHRHSKRDRSGTDCCIRNAGADQCHWWRVGFPGGDFHSGRNKPRLRSGWACPEAPLRSPQMQALLACLRPFWSGSAPIRLTSERNKGA